MKNLLKLSAFIICVLFCAKTFFAAFFALSSYPRGYYLNVQISAYAHPTTYLWVTFILNVFAFFSGFWLFAGLYEDLLSYFSPALTGIKFFLTGDLLMHSVLIFITDVFHDFMIFNFCTSVLFSPCMYIVYRSCKDFEVINPEQILRPSRVSNLGEITV